MKYINIYYTLEKETKGHNVSLSFSMQVRLWYLVLKGYEIKSKYNF